MILSELLRKWFGLEAIPCATCEVLREMLAKSERERADLLHRLLDKPQAEPPPAEMQEFKPIQPQFTPWRVRQQLLEQEDRKKAELMKKRAAEISELEKELEVSS